jgi:hypothetical protein
VTIEDGALARPDRAGVVVRRAVAERHVHEHDPPQPARLWHEHLGRGGGDQPVEQRQGTVGDLPDGAGEGGVPGSVGPRPGAGHGVLVHRPAEGGEPGADPAVVGVAAARPRRVVEARGNDDVDLLHSGRS